MTTALVLAMAWNTGANLLYLVFAGLASFQIISFILGRMVLRGLHVVRDAPDAVHQGEACPVTVRIENQKHLLGAMSLRLEHVEKPGVSLGYVYRVPRRQAAIIRVDEFFGRRGVHALPQMALVSRFPFGLSESRVVIEDEQSVVVYPRVRAVRTARMDTTAPGGAVTKRFQSEGDEFFSLRDYSPGDDIRRISWRVSARFGHLVVKELEAQSVRHVLFVLDTSCPPDESMDSPDFDARFEEIIELAASLAVTVLNRTYSVSLYTPRGAVPEGDGRRQQVEILEFLARAAPCERAPGGDPFAFAERAEASHAAVIYLSPEPARWGVARPGGDGRVLDPREVIYA